jgi:hypothetical protein
VQRCTNNPPALAPLFFFLLFIFLRQKKGKRFSFVYIASAKMEQERYRDIAATLGADLFAKVQAAKVLVVGAGGIGCELLKNLVMMGFVDIETVPPPSAWLSGGRRGTV